MLQSIIEQTARLDPHIFSIIIENEDGIILAKWKNHDSQPSFSPVSFSEQVIFEGEAFGKITIKWMFDAFYQMIKDNVRQSRLLITSIIILLAVIIIFCIHCLAIRPIRRNHQQLVDISKGNNASELNLLTSKELTYLSESANTLKDLIQLQKSHELELELSDVDLEMLFESSLVMLK